MASISEINPNYKLVRLEILDGYDVVDKRDGFHLFSLYKSFDGWVGAFTTGTRVIKVRGAKTMREAFLKIQAVKY